MQYFSNKKTALISNFIDDNYKDICKFRGKKVCLAIVELWIRLSIVLWDFKRNTKFLDYYWCSQPN